MAGRCCTRLYHARPPAQVCVKSELWQVRGVGRGGGSGGSGGEICLCLFVCVLVCKGVVSVCDDVCWLVFFGKLECLEMFVYAPSSDTGTGQVSALHTRFISCSQVCGGMLEPQRLLGCCTRSLLFSCPYKLCDH